MFICCFVHNCVHASITHKNEINEVQQCVIRLSVLVWNYIFLPSANWMLSSHSELGAFCMWIWECCSHNRLFLMWLSAIFPSLHHGPKKPKTNVTTTQACGSPLCSTLPHPNTSNEAQSVLWCHGAILYYQSFPWICEIKASSDRDEQLMIMNDHSPCSQPNWYCEGAAECVWCCICKDRND